MLDPCFEQHFSPAQLVHPDSSVMLVRLLRETGALQFIVCSRIQSNTDYAPTGELRLIRGITGYVIPVPLVEVTLSSSVCKGTFLCGLVSTLPDGIAVIAATVADVSLSSLGPRRRKPDNQHFRSLPHLLTLPLRQPGPDYPMCTVCTCTVGPTTQEAPPRWQTKNVIDVFFANRQAALWLKL